MSFRQASGRRQARAGSAALLSLLLLAGGAAPAQLVERFRGDSTGAGQVAVQLARQALDSYCLRREQISIPEDVPPLLRERGAVFVSAMVHGAPRCCMGSLYPRGSNLAADIIEAATRAAAHDARFPPLRAAELPKLRVIVSILDPPEPVLDPYHLDPVTEGLAVRASRRTGVVLPGETKDLEKFVAWGRIRAAVAPKEKPDYFRLRAIRYIEPSGGAGLGS